MILARMVRTTLRTDSFLNYFQDCKFEMEERMTEIYSQQTIKTFFKYKTSKRLENKQNIGKVMCQYIDILNSENRTLQC